VDLDYKSVSPNFAINSVNRLGALYENSRIWRRQHSLRAFGILSSET